MKFPFPKTKEKRVQIGTEFYSVNWHTTRLTLTRLLEFYSVNWHTIRELQSVPSHAYFFKVSLFSLFSSPMQSLVSPRFILFFVFIYTYSVYCASWSLIYYKCCIYSGFYLLLVCSFCLWSRLSCRLEIDL